MSKKYVTILFCFCVNWVFAQQKIIVDIHGNGQFTTIQAAINSLSPDAKEQRIIFVKKGMYRERVLIDKHQIALIGEDKIQTQIITSIARDSFRCANADDWGVATINLKGSDITLENLTFINEYGFTHSKEQQIVCANDTSGKEKKIRKDGHQMALRSFATTRLKVINCSFKAYGGDTVSPWNVEEGMFYFKDCDMEGGVDFYCPRGWAYAENCKFYAHTGPAAIWHDGSKNQDAKTVLVNCFFDGYEGFKLGRWHKDAQFYLINCNFSKAMSNTPIYKVATTNSILWGDNRQYFFNCHRQGGDFEWFANNLEQAPGKPTPSTITPNWVFGNKWKL